MLTMIAASALFIAAGIGTLFIFACMLSSQISRKEEDRHGKE